MKKLFPAFLLSFLFCGFTSAQLEMDCDGDVQIGNNAFSTEYKLDVRGGAYYSCNASSGFYLTNFSTAPLLKPQWGNSAYIGLSNQKIYRTYSYYVTCVTLTEESDSRLKENVRDLDNSLSLINKVRGVKYDLKEEFYEGTPQEKMDFFMEERKDHIGFIAQELKEVIPELVIYNEESELYEVDYIGMIPFLAEAIQEQQMIIDDLQSEVQALSAESTLKSASLLSAANDAEQRYENLLGQNAPNPFHEKTDIQYSLSKSVQHAVIYIYDMSGSQLKSFNLSRRGENSISIHGGELDPGMYMYAMVADGKVIDTKRMILTD